MKLSELERIDISTVKGVGREALEDAFMKLQDLFFKSTGMLVQVRDDLTKMSEQIEKLKK